MLFFLTTLAILAISCFFKFNLRQILQFQHLPTSLQQFLALVAQHSSPFTLRIRPVVVVTVHKPEHMQIVLNSPHCLDKSFMYRFFRVDRGLFGSPASIWRHDRKALGPSLGPSILPKAVPVFNEKMALCVQLMENHVGRERDFVNDIGRCMLDALFVITFGVDFDLQRNPEGKQCAAFLGEFVHIATNRVYKPWTYPEFLYRFTKAYKRECELLNFGYEITDKIVQAHSEHRSNRIDNVDTKIFIEKILELRQSNTKGDIQYLRDHMVTMILAGSETTMSVVSNVLLMLAVHQDIQERVHQELVEAIGSDQQEFISQESVANLPYFEMVCKETMRLFPVAGIAGREATKDIVLDENHTIPANAIVCPAFYQMYRDPQIWGPTAAQFDPERFQPDVAAQRHPYAFIPFMAGPRMCPGMRYGWLAMKIMVGHVLRKYHLRTSLAMEDIRPEFLLLMRIEQGCPVTLTVR